MPRANWGDLASPKNRALNDLKLAFAAPKLRLDSKALAGNFFCQAAKNPNDAMMKEIPPRICEECKKEYKPKRVWQRYCTKQCKNNAYWKTHAIVEIKSGT